MCMMISRETLTIKHCSLIIVNQKEDVILMVVTLIECMRLVLFSSSVKQLFNYATLTLALWARLNRVQSAAASEIVKNAADHQSTSHQGVYL